MRSRVMKIGSGIIITLLALLSGSDALGVPGTSGSGTRYKVLTEEEFNLLRIGWDRVIQATTRAGLPHNSESVLRVQIMLDFNLYTTVIGLQEMQKQVMNTARIVAWQMSQARTLRQAVRLSEMWHTLWNYIGYAEGRCPEFWRIPGFSRKQALAWALLRNGPAVDIFRPLQIIIQSKTPALEREIVLLRKATWVAYPEHLSKSTTWLETIGSTFRGNVHYLKKFLYNETREIPEVNKDAYNALISLYDSFSTHFLAHRNFEDPSTVCWQQGLRSWLRINAKTLGDMVKGSGMFAQLEPWLMKLRPR